MYAGTILLFCSALRFVVLDLDVHETNEEGISLLISP